METIAGKYKVLKVLGEGATGKVYLVEHTEIGAQYALKLLTPPPGDQERFIERFKHEAGVLSRFTHPGSAQLREFGRTDDGRYFMTMDFLRGKTLKEIIDQRKYLPPAEALQMVERVLDILDAAHQAGIVHRDVKPDNIMLVTEGVPEPQVKIMDFGVAKLRDIALTSTVTLEGTTIGTPQYMSPEQAAGEKDLDHRSDLYGTGIVLYEMLTGELPFLGETVLQTMLMQLTKEPKEFNPARNVPDYIQDLVHKALQKDRNKRFKGAGEFREACAKARRRVEGGDKGDLPKTGTSPTVSAPVSEGRGRKILCLDDDPMILQITKFILEKEGYVVFTASDPSQIHHFIFEEHVDLMVCDVQMPGLPGPKVCKMIKDSTAKLKIILFSNIDEKLLKKLSIESKADGCMSKLAKPEEWLKIIKAKLEAA